jgi:hypothetical protein
VGLNQDEPGKFLEAYGSALGAGDLEGILSSWGIPSLVISDQGAIAVSSPEQVKEFFAHAVAWYHSQGWVETRPREWHTEKLSPVLFSVDVYWDAIDQSGQSFPSDHSRYILSLFEGRFVIRVAITQSRV